MPSKKIERDEKGHPILEGAKTFGTVVKPKGGRYQSRATQLKGMASSRLVFLMIGKRSDKQFEMHKKDKEALDFQNDLARQNEVVRFAYFKGKLDELNRELKELLESGNKRKIQLLEATLRKNIAEVTDVLNELMATIRSEK